MWQTKSQSYALPAGQPVQRGLLLKLAGCLAILAVAAAFALVSLATPVRSQEFREAGKAPPHWAQFAKLVRYRFEDWMGADDEVGNRFRAYLRDQRGKEDDPPRTIEVRAWLNPDGTIEKVSFAPLSNAQATADLRTLLTRGNIGEAPPPEMLQPLRMRLTLNLK